MVLEVPGTTRLCVAVHRGAPTHVHRPSPHLDLQHADLVVRPQAHIQAQIDETVGVMRDNIQKVNERGENLSDLQGKTGGYLARGRGGEASRLL